MYTQTSHTVITATPSPYSYLLLRDDLEDAFSEVAIEEHFNNIQALVTERIADLGKPYVVATDAHEKELHFMLDALIQAKRSLDDT